MDGREIVVEPTGGGEAEVRTPLVGSALGACLRQRGILTLHASAVETRAGAVLFPGHSGSGKSTLLAALLERGYAMLADDVTGIRVDARGRAVALSAFPAVKLRPEVVDALACRARTVERTRQGADKHVVQPRRFRVAPLAVCTVATLRTHDRNTLAIRPAQRQDVARMLVRYSYRRRTLNGLGGYPEYLRGVAALAKQVTAWRILRPAHSLLPDRLAGEVERHLRMERREEEGSPRIESDETTARRAVAN